MKNDWIIQFEEVPNFLHEPCIGCDEVDEIKCYTMKGSGPYCEQCFGARKLPALSPPFMDGVSGRVAHEFGMEAAAGADDAFA
jgi:hypothetical protein